MIARYLLLFTVGGLLVIYLISATNEFRAQRCAASGNFDCAITLQPTNSDYYRARARQYRLGSANYALAIKDLKQAVSLNPHDAEAWMDLADAQFALGDSKEVAVSLNKAISTDFTTPSIHWRAGTYLLAMDNVPLALAQMRLAIQMNHYLSSEGIRVAWSLNHEANDVFKILPATQYSYVEALHFFIHEDQLDGALLAWHRLQTAGALIEPHEKAAPDRQELIWRHAKALVDYLLSKRAFDAASNTWKEACESSANESYCDSSNLVTNGGFEEPLLEKGSMTGFDWRPLSSSVHRDSLEFFEGQYSLRIDFEDGNHDESTVMQWLSVPPSTKLIAHGMYKPSLRPTSGRVELVVEDVGGKRLASVELQKERVSWNEFDLSFQSPAEAGGLNLRVMSSPPVDGSLWIDAVRMEIQR